MIPYILIDTCIWNKLVSPKDFSYLLATLEPLVLNDNAKLLAPEVLLEEWGKHRESTAKEKIDKFFRDQSTQAHIKKLLDLQSGMLLEETIAEAKSKLYSQISRIDFLLNEYALKIDESQGVINLIFEQQKLNKAPFHIRGKDSHKDGRLIFAALDYLKNNNISNIVFISSNTDDFAEKNENSFVIHSDIQSVFPDINIQYFDHFKPSYEFIIEFYKIPKPKENEPYRKRKLNRVPIDRSRPITDQIHQYFSVQFEHIDILPKDLFLEQYPFYVDERNMYGRRAYTLITDNKELYNLLTSVKVEKGALICAEGTDLTELDRDKLYHILKLLRSNLVYFISFEDNDPIPLIFENADIICNCFECLYQKLQFPALFQKLSEVCESPADNLQAAYILYKTGHYYESACLFKSILEQRAETKDTLTFIISNNLRRLASVIDFRYGRDQEAQNLSSELSQLDIEDILSEAKTPQNNKLLEYIYYTEFYDKAYGKMSRLVNKIKELFYSKSSGFNDNTRELTEEYFSTVQFLNKNYILFDIYSEFTSLTTLFTEGLIASYGSNPRLGGKLLYFDDTLLKLLLIYGSHEEIRKCMRRYKVQKIEYRPNAKKDLSFYHSFLHLLQSYPALVENEVLRSYKESYFWDDFSTMVCNGVVLCSYLDMDSSNIQILGWAMLNYAKIEKHQHYHSFNKVLEVFIYRQRDSLDDKLVVEFLKLALTKDAMHDESIFETIVDEIAHRNLLLSLNSDEFQNFKNTFLGKEPTPHEGHKWRLIGYVYSILDNEHYKTEISGIVQEELLVNFDSKKFYLANAFNMVPSTDSFLQQYEDYILSVAKKGRNSNLFSDKDYFHDYRIDEYFNFCFKHQLPLSKSIQAEIPNLGEYYIWLSDIDKFDYSRFNYRWLFNHFTLYYKRRYRDSTILRDHVLSIIREKDSHELDRFYINTWCKLDD